MHLMSPYWYGTFLTTRTQREYLTITVENQPGCTSYKHPLTLSLSLMFMKQTCTCIWGLVAVLKREGSRFHHNKPMLYQIGFLTTNQIALIFDNWSSSFRCKHGENRKLCNSMHYQELRDESCKCKDWPTYFFKFSTLFNDDSKENTIREKKVDSFCSAVVILWTQLHLYACNDNIKYTIYKCKSPIKHCCTLSCRFCDTRKKQKKLTRSIGFRTHRPNPHQLPGLQLDLHRFPLRFPFGEKDGDNQTSFEDTEYLNFRRHGGHLSLLLQRSSINFEVTRVT